MHDKTWYARLVLLLCVALSISFAGRGEAARIETVEAHITAAGSLPKVVEARMAERVRVIGEQLLLGKDAEGERIDDDEDLCFKPRRGVPLILLEMFPCGLA